MPQVVAERLVDALKGKYGDKSDAIIGIVDADMYVEDAKNQQYAVHYRDRQEHDSRPFAVISTARLDPRSFGIPPDPELLNARVRKLYTATLASSAVLSPLLAIPAA